jgi:hypothetical protein
MLRDVLTTLPGFGTWPCDEINYIWRHGNRGVNHDEFGIEEARPEVRKYIRRQFDKMAKSLDVQYLIEKTCANSMRVPFVDAVIPEARYLHIVRDGRDAAPSASKRWNADLDLPYVLRKARFVPLSDAPYYAFRYLWNHIWRRVIGKGRLKTWGPRFVDMDEAAARFSQNELSALQWARSVDLADKAFEEIPPERVHSIRYEQFVSNPREELVKVLEFLGAELNDEEIDKAVSLVRTGSVGKGKRELKSDETNRILPKLEKTLKRHRYEL